jgi:DNA-binding XRE family transcriptional regulator
MQGGILKIKQKSFPRILLAFWPRSSYLWGMTNETAPIPQWQAKLRTLLTVDRMALGLKMGVTERTIYNWAHGKSAPSKATVAYLARWAR